MTIILLTLALFVGLFGLVQPGGYLKAPTLAGLVFGLWFAPQFAYVAQSPFLSTGAVLSVGLTACLALLFVMGGWYLGLKSDRKSNFIKPIPVEQLLIPLAIMTAITTGLNILLEQMRPSMANISQWSGPIVIVNFFAQLRIISLALSLMLFLRKRTPATISLLAVNIIVNIPFALFLMRRSEMIDMGIVVLGSLWFARRIRVPTPVVLGGLVAFAVVVFSMTSLRSTQNRLEQTSGETISLLSPQLWSEIDIADTVTASARNAPDVRNAAFSVQLVNDLGQYSYGASTWNSFIHQFVPGQLVGSSVKESLLVQDARLQTSEMSTRYNFFYQTGTTSTGVGSAYREFGYFGSLFFLLMGLVLGRLYSFAMRGSLYAQLGYICMVPFLLTSITHGHDKFFVMMPLYAFGIGVLFVLTRIFVLRPVAPPVRRHYRQVPAE